MLSSEQTVDEELDTFAKSINTLDQWSIETDWTGPDCLINVIVK